MKYLQFRKFLLKLIFRPKQVLRKVISCFTTSFSDKQQTKFLKLPLTISRKKYFTIQVILLSSYVILYIYNFKILVLNYNIKTMKANLPVRLDKAFSNASLESLPLKKSCTSQTLFRQLQAKMGPQKNNCRSHPDVKGIYFLTEQPWIRLCKQCALNKALCGHQIQKEYSQQEFEKKITLTSIIQDIQGTIQNAENEGKYLEEVAGVIDKTYKQNIASHIKIIDDLMKDLNKLRDSVYSIYEVNISKKMSELYEKQGHLKNCSVNLQKHLENIENNYCDLISGGQEDEEQFERLLEIVKGEIGRTRENIYMEYQKKELEKGTEGLVEMFASKFIQIKSQKHILQNLVIPGTKSTNQQPQEQQKNSSQIISVENRKQPNLSERQSFPVPMDETRFYSGRQKYKKNNPMDENVTNRRQANLSLRSSSKKQSICSISKVQTSCKKGTGLKESSASMFNAYGNGELYFP